MMNEVIPPDLAQQSMVLSSLKSTYDVMLTPNSMTFLNQTFESYVCSSNTGWKNVSIQPCSVEQLDIWSACFRRHIYRKHIRVCKKRFKDFTCIFLMIYALDSQHLVKKYGNLMHLCSKYYGRNAPFEIVLSSEILLSCNLTTRGNGLVHYREGRTKNDRCSIKSTACNHRIVIFLARAAISWILRFPAGQEMARKERHSIGCWDPEMAEAQHLYYKTGRWDVDDVCIDIVQTIGLRMLKRVFRTWYEDAQSEQSVLFKFQRTFLSFVASVLTLGQHSFLQATYYRVFLRFKAVAKRRSGPMNGPVVISCRGLRGPRADVKRTVETLIRLVLVDVLDHSQFKTATSLAVLPATTTLPCLIEKYL